MFESDFFTANRARLRQLFTGTAPIVITGHGLLQKGSDEAYPFHQDSSFWYLTGLDEPDLILVMDKDKEYLIIPTREVIREQFDGAIDPDALTRRSGIKEILGQKEGWHRLEGRLKRVQHAATLGANPKYLDGYGMYTNPARAELIARIKKINDELELLDLRSHLSRMRMVKQAPELAAIQQAIDITITTLKEVTRPRQLAKYGYEYELEADITRGFRRQGSTGHAFTPIVAAGARACTIHHKDNNGPLASDELVVLDVGAQVERYAADITRTVSMAHASRRQRQVYDAVADVQQFAFALLKPGVKIREYEKQIEEYMGEKLRELGLIKSITREAVRTYYPHATSHFLGLDVHDGGDYELPLEPGVVLTVEPGIYIPEEGIGVRIEDDALITQEGARNLSQALSRDLA